LDTGLSDAKLVLDPGSVFEDAAIGRDGHDLPGDHLAALLQGFLGGEVETATARNFHADDGDAADVILAENLRQFFGVIPCVELGTADHGDFALDEFLVEIGPGVSGAIGSDQELGALVKWSLDREQLDLDRPLLELGVGGIRINRSLGGHRGWCSSNRSFGTVEGALGIAWAAAEDRLGCSSGFCSCFGFHLEIGRGTWGGRCEFVSFTFLDRDGVGRAGRQASTQSVTVRLLDQAGFAIDQGQGALVTTDDAIAAAIALFFIDHNNVTLHEKILSCRRPGLEPPVQWVQLVFWRQCTIMNTGTL